MKLRLRVTDGTLAGLTFEIESGFLTIGRGENCSVRFDPLSERIASKQHCFIEARADGFYITDNQSTNGTFVNGSSASISKLANGDHIQFGRNGVTAEVAIESTTSISNVPGESFRDLEVQNFNQFAANSSISVQNSITSLGLGNISAIRDEAGSRPGKNYVIAAIVVMAFVFLAIVAFFLIASTLSRPQNGSMTLGLDGVILAILASLVAFIPSVLYIFPLFWLDRYDPEPPWLLACAYAWGALVAVNISFVVNTSVEKVAEQMTGNEQIANLIGGVVSAPIVEEGTKGLGLLLLLLFFRKYFDDILDGIVFAGVIALGFATVENVIYYGRAIGVGGAEGIAISFVMRGIMTPFAHVTFTSMTGIGCGIARESHNKLVRILPPVVGYMCAVALHAIFNGMAFLGGLKGFVTGYIVLELPFFCILVGFAFYVMHRQGKILKDMLAIDIARGLITPELGKTVTSAFKSSGWLIGGLFSGKYLARSRYLRACGKLGLSYWHMQRATAAQGQTGSFQQNPLLREEVLKWRDRI